tara:strand:- start:18 stop:1436 length:1419 start_codon:yes stop_codon:yes gene_type:complete
MVFQNNVLSGAAGSGTTTHTIDQSIRFNDDDSAYMYRTPSSASNRKTFTISFWFKTTVSGSFQTLLGAYDNSSRSDSTYFGIWQGSTGNMGLGVWSTNYISTTRKIRDPSAWFHCVYSFDSTDTLSTDRVKLYINGQRETDITYNAPSLNHDFGWNLNQVHSIGRINYLTGTGPYYTDGYLAEIYNIDGQALDCNSFGEFNSSGIWIPKDASALTFGTNGFYIKGENAADLGNDSSGNNNDFTVSGLAAHDQVLDSPTNNFAVLNPLDNRGTPGTLSEGNLKMAFSATNDNVTGTFGMSSGKWYWEAHIVDKSDTYIGVQDSAISATGYTASAVALWSGSYIYENNSDTGDRSVSYDNGDVVGIAFDADNKKIWWSKNGQWYSADDSSANTTINISEVEAGNQAQVITRSPDFFMPFFGNYTHSTAIFNFGQEGTFAGNETAGGNSDGNGVGNFFSTVPSGFLALCTNNLGS